MKLNIIASPYNLTFLSIEREVFMFYPCGFELVTQSPCISDLFLYHFSHLDAYKKRSEMTHGAVAHIPTLFVETKMDLCQAEYFFKYSQYNLHTFG